MVACQCKLLEPVGLLGEAEGLVVIADLEEPQRLGGEVADFRGGAVRGLIGELAANQGEQLLVREDAERGNVRPAPRIGGRRKG